MIIEFTGVPCSGKSDISHELAKLLREAGFSVCEHQYELSHNANSKKRALTKASACLTYCLMHPVRALGFYRRIGSVGCWMNYIFLLTNRCKKDFCILEQGYLQLVGSLFDNTDPDAEKMDRLFKALVPQENILQVFITATEKTVLTRANARADKPFYIQADSPEAALSQSFATAKLLQQVWCQNKGETKFISASNDEDDAQKKVAQTVFDAMKQKELL